MFVMDRREQMRRWLEQRERERLTFRQLSERTGVPLGTLACWAWKLRREGAPRPSRRPGDARFVELVAAPVESAGRVEIVLRGERRLIVDASIDEPSLVRIVSALDRC